MLQSYVGSVPNLWFNVLCPLKILITRGITSTMKFALPIKYDYTAFTSDCGLIAQPVSTRTPNKQNIKGQKFYFQ